MSPALIALAAQTAAPFVRKILTDKIGAGKAGLVEEVIGQIATHAGAAPRELDDLAQTAPERVSEAIRQTEAMAPELVALYATGLEKQFDLLAQDAAQPVWFSAWRPLWMYFLMALWAWNTVLLHLLNALLKWALPPMEMTALLSLTGLFMALYMGGHTIKDVAARFGARS